MTTTRKFTKDFRDVQGTAKKTQTTQGKIDQMKLNVQTVNKTPYSLKIFRHL